MDNGLNEFKSLINDENNLLNIKDDFSKITYLEFKNYLKNQLLRDADWAGMANSVEIRVPFIDREFIDQCLKLNLKNRSDKNILLELEHIITSSYIPFERQNFSLPSSKEALALNSIKQLDTNLNVFKNIISLEADEDGITSKHNLFGRQIFKFLNVD